MNQAAEIFVTSRLFERIVQSPQNLIAIETADTADVLAQFRRLALRTGQSVYTWEPDIGLTSLRESAMPVPSTRRMSDALRYILQSMQFGVYLFHSGIERIRPPNTGLLRQVSRIRTGNGRKVAFVAASLHLPEGLDELLERITYSQTGSTGSRPRLRDGRWVT
ncbi:MAG TPA: hypothetical protein VF132_02345 [Rudaea sp.]